MNDSKRLAVLKALTAHLVGITPANGYEFDLTGAVFRGRAVFGADMPLPSLSLLESAKPEIAVGGSENDLLWSGEWMLLLQGWVLDDVNNPTDPAYQLMASVEQRLSDIIAVKQDRGTPVYPALYRLGGLISGLGIGPGVARPADQLSSKAYFYIPLKVCLATDVRNPFVAT